MHCGSDCELCQSPVASYQSPRRSLCYTRYVTRIRRDAWGFACASGVLQVLIFPKPSLYFLSWVALAPLIYAVLQCRNQDALLTMVEDGKWYAPATAWQGFPARRGCSRPCRA